MPDTKTAALILEIVVGAAIAMILGDYLGNRVGRTRLVIGLGIIILIAIIAFAVVTIIQVQVRNSS